MDAWRVDLDPYLGARGSRLFENWSGSPHKE